MLLECKILLLPDWQNSASCHGDLSGSLTRSDSCSLGSLPCWDNNLYLLINSALFNQFLVGGRYWSRLGLGLEHLNGLLFEMIAMMMEPNFKKIGNVFQKRMILILWLQILHTGNCLIASIKHCTFLYKRLCLSQCCFRCHFFSEKKLIFLVNYLHQNLL